MYCAHNIISWTIIRYYSSFINLSQTIFIGNNQFFVIIVFVEKA